MYKDTEKQREANRKAAQKHRKGMTQGMTEEEGMTPKGMTSEGMTEGMTREGITSKQGMTGQGMTDYPDIMDKLTDKENWRPRLERICQSFRSSNHPEYAHDVMLGVAVNLDERAYPISEACALLEATR